jgi:hypothetical protein
MQEYAYIVHTQYIIIKQYIIRRYSCGCCLASQGYANIYLCQNCDAWFKYTIRTYLSLYPIQNQYQTGTEILSPILHPTLTCNKKLANWIILTVGR